jgi:hypothetical protein
MQRHLQDTAAPRHPDEAVSAAVIIELRHHFLSAQSAFLILPFKGRTEADVSPFFSLEKLCKSIGWM